MNKAVSSHHLLHRQPALADYRFTVTSKLVLDLLTKMSSFRLLSSVARRAPSFALGRRGYADVSDKLKLTFVLPHKVSAALRFRAELEAQ